MSGNESLSAPPPTSPSSGKSPVLLVILAVVAVAVAGGVIGVVALGALFWLNRAPNSPTVAEQPTSAAPVASPVANQKVAIDGPPIDLLTKIDEILDPIVERDPGQTATRSPKTREA